MNVIPVFTVSQPVDVSVDDYVWLVNGVAPTITPHVPRPYTETVTSTYGQIVPFKLKVSEACYLKVLLEGDTAASVQYFSEGENNQMVVRVYNDIGNTLDGSAQDGDIVAYR
ncbi:MAG: hypothetical protein EOM68_07220 [Spirochaetia bacterium]|nr:hypothetical protein [Spirochaetia bacterium]